MIATELRDVNKVRLQYMIIENVSLLNNCTERTMESIGDIASDVTSEPVILGLSQLPRR